MKKITVFLLAFFAMLSTSYGQVKETRGVGNFTAIKASSSVNVVYTQGPIQNIEVTWEKDLMKFLKVETKNNVLKIFIENREFALVVSSEATGKECIEYGIKDFSVCNLGVDLKMFNPSKRNIKIDNTLRVGFFYYNHPRKNPRLIESVVEILIREHPEIEIHIFGNGFDNDSGKVSLVTAVNEYAYANRIANLDLFVYISKIEGFGLPPLEAMASGVPVIASNVGAVSAYMINEVNGIILENYCDVSDIVKSIERVLSDGTLKNRLLKNGLLASQNWSWNSTCDNYLAIIENINKQ